MPLIAVVVPDEARSGRLSLVFQEYGCMDTLGAQQYCNVDISIADPIPVRLTKILYLSQVGSAIRGLTYKSFSLKMIR